MTGREFEDMCIRKLSNAGYWAHRIHPDESGQQPFDIIAVKGYRISFYDAKVVSKGMSFSMSRLEDNQYNSFALVSRKVRAEEIGLLIYAEGTIYYMDFVRIERAVRNGEKRIRIGELPIWVPEKQ